MIFEDRTSTSDDFKFKALKGAFAWKIRVDAYLISRDAAVYQILYCRKTGFVSVRRTLPEAPSRFPRATVFCFYMKTMLVTLKFIFPVSGKSRLTLAAVRLTFDCRLSWVLVMPYLDHVLLLWSNGSSIPLRVSLWAHTTGTGQIPGIVTFELHHIILWVLCTMLLHN